MTRASRLADAQGRVMRDLRVSVTDRCNLRCLYCLPDSDAALQSYRIQPRARSSAYPPPPVRWQPRAQLLTFEEIERVVRIAVSLGIEKIRLTGGEPLLRRDVEQLVARLARIEGIRDLAMTSNGIFFLPKARVLREAGLQRVTFSLDSLDRENFRKITGRDGLSQVLASIAAAQAVGLRPVKVNTVVIRGMNDHEIEALALWACQQQVALRFIEFMPLDAAQVWLKNLVVPGHEILAKLRDRFPLEPHSDPQPSETAQRWRLVGQPTELGIIAPVSEPFCGQCNRLRLTADGKIRTCLFSMIDHDVRHLLRQGASDETLAGFLQGVVWQKEPRHHIGEDTFVAPARSMSCIGG